MARVTREGGVIPEEPESRYTWRLGSHTLNVEATVARNDDHAADRWCATEAWEAIGARRKHKEPVPRKEGRLH